MSAACFLATLPLQVISYMLLRRLACIKLAQCKVPALTRNAGKWGAQAHTYAICCAEACGTSALIVMPDAQLTCMALASSSSRQI